MSVFQSNYSDDDELKSFSLPSFEGGYNSYSQSKTFIKDNEIPEGATNVLLDDNGSVTKRNGKTRYGPQVASGHAVYGLGWLKNSSHNKVIVVSNTAWYYDNGTTTTALTGTAFTADKLTTFEQAFDKLYGANNTDNLAYTSNGTSTTHITSNGNIGLWPTFFNQRLYMTNSTSKDRIYYSNPYALDLSTNPPTLTGFDDANMYNTDLTASPKKNAGYIVLMPGGGVEITRLYRDNIAGADYLFATTKNHGIWRIAMASADQTSGAIAHSVIQIVPSGGCPAGRSVIKANNDTWFYDGYNLNTYGEAATFQNARVTAKGGRVKSEVTSIAAAGRDDVAAVFFDSKVYVAYMAGTYNDRVLVYDTVLNAWSSPFTNWAVSCWLVYEDDSGTRRLLAGSSNSSDSYVYQVDTGTDDQGSAISSMFQTKSTDCKQPGLVKRFAFVDVFYGMVFGTLSYAVLIDEVTNITGSLQLGNSSSRTVGIGSMIIGTFMIGAEYDTNTTFATLTQNDDFRIDCEYTAGKRIAVEFTNEVSGEQFKINAVRAHYLEGSINEEI